MYQNLEKRFKKLKEHLNDLQTQLATYHKGWGCFFSNIFSRGNTGQSIVKTQQDITEILKATNSLEKEVENSKNKNIDELKELENKIKFAEFQTDEYDIQKDVEKITGITAKKPRS